MSTRAGTPLGRSALTAFTWLVAVLFVFPLLWMVLTSFKQEADAYTDPPRLVFTPTLEQFAGILERGFLPYLGNSAFVTVVSTVLVLLMAVPASYALSIAAVPGTRDALGFFLSTKMLPIVAAIIPLYVISQNLKLLDNVWALVVLYTAMNLPLAVWMMRSFFLEVPKEMVEAGRVDGANLPTLLFRVVLPVVAPGIAATALICVIFSWTEFFYAVNLTAAQAGTVPVFLVGFITSEGLYWAQLSAAALLASLPVMVVGWIAQNHLVRGLSMGAVK
ncbi:carbohydrate ABC transporter membrane protein 2 (CUT1 family) [Saccharopolyspora erythraea NRRL 2338]|uniref:ABC sugar transporter, permease component n=2 Tax=Saccharopolyspora erythraea TaxID=1836 RepID=A4FHA4_SACEN|nr:carbohydrate ABC transporter permease [Saccharopolyspora erythraea]EQD86837.1 mannitol ABC transporter permease [Saccharopolyspora erythraea D]PFG97129.1 carbohydrate ABC transporter membrane protein 2 (CUT1 family) [Saccharopolyspora erythraea NRRL 2338]QRK87332.1 carbohydrate ABC transporter permease [Saccharopolyspora erythraea]CAM03429.1 ABC sugar transporter, permease component [Saccharopolyspora erythraea NRRL 2338]